LTLAAVAVSLKLGAAAMVTATVVCAVREPEVAAMVTVAGTTAAEAEAVSVSLLVVAVDEGLKDAVTPLGSPVAASVVEPLNPFAGITVMVVDPEAPWVMFRLAGDAPKMKLGAALTVKLSVTDSDKVPEAPFTVTVDVPGAAVGDAVKVTAPAPKDAVTPLGNPLAAKVGVPVKPFCGVTVMVAVPDAPCVMLRLAGDAPSTKLEAALTVTLSVVQADSVPEIPVTATVNTEGPADAAALNVKVVEVAVVCGLKEAVTPVGNPLTSRIGEAVNPLSGFTVMLLVPDVPCVIVRLAGDADRVKLGAALMVRPMLVEADNAPEVPVTVTVDVPCAAVGEAVSITKLAP